MWLRFKWFVMVGVMVAVSQAAGAESEKPNGDREPFYVYKDADYKKNHFTPAGYMGDIGDIQVQETCKENPHSGTTCIKISYSAKGNGPNECDYPAPCKWAGVYWQYPPNNWGKDEEHKGKGFDLRRFDHVVFWARADAECKIDFKIGGIGDRYGDSLKKAISLRTPLTTSWKKFEIDLKGKDLSHIIGGFCWTTDWNTNPDGATFYLDDIAYEVSENRPR